jgi:hypothetical protein
MAKNMASMLSNLSITMCHAFIKDQNLMSPLINLLDTSYDEQTNKASEKPQ